jgi:predicted acylesterase/phospholipase RssA
MAERRKCDIVMQGGVTSGVVYPGLITKLAEQYDFQNIGGTSAGAIAACLTAAAEYARRRSPSSDPFAALNEIAEWLGADQGKDKNPPPKPDARLDNSRKSSNLFALFQPQPQMEGLFRFALVFLTTGTFRKIKKIVPIFVIEILLGLAPGLLLGYLALQIPGLSLWQLLVHLFSHPTPRDLLGLALTILVCIAGLAVTFAAGLILRIIRIPANRYGFCTGNAEPAGKSAPALVPWLHQQINAIAGLPHDHPLTFGDLEDTFVPGDETVVPGEPLKKKGINLRMMTTCLTWQRPFTLPFTSHIFYFSPDEFRRYFPEEIVQWLQDHPPTRAMSAPGAAAGYRTPAADDDNPELPHINPADSEVPPRTRRLPIDTTGLCPLPDQKDLPIVVAARLSLSFPLLFCTVPLYAVDFSLREAEPGEATSSSPGTAVPYGGPRRPERVWFTDGGICNNFPLHLFDAPLPLWPTFGIDLTDFRDDGRNDKFRTHIPISNGGGLTPNWTRITKGGFKGTFDLAVAIVNSARNWVNSLQAAVPGYRDRIVHVALKKEEGGLNLVMPADLVTTLNQYGAEAGDLLIEHFINGTDHGKPTPMTWDNQRWIRYRSTMAQLETFLKTLSFALNNPQPGDRTYYDLLTRGPKDPPSAYRLDPALIADALAETQGADALGALMSKTVPRDNQTTLNSCGTISDKLCPPRPQPDLVIRPHF